MYTWVKDGEGFEIVFIEGNDGEYFAYTDTEEKADMIVTLLNQNLIDFESGYEVGNKIISIVGGIQ